MTLRPDAAWPAARRPRPALWGLLLAAHLLAFLGWQASLQHSRLGPASAETPAGLSWLRLLPLPAEEARPASPMEPAASLRAQPRAQPPALPTPQRPATPEAAAPSAITAPPPEPSAAPAQRPGTLSLPPAAAEPAAVTPPAGTLLDSEASRRALRDLARQPGLGERSAQVLDQPARSSAQRMAEAASAAGKGDCGKGQYAGSGAGLLSLPFLAAALARGDCAR